MRDLEAERNKHVSSSYLFSFSFTFLHTSSYLFSFSFTFLHTNPLSHTQVSLSLRNPLSWKTHFWPLKVEPNGHEVCVIVVMAHIISMEQSLPKKDESKNDGETSRDHDIAVFPTDAVSTSCDIVVN